MSYKKPTRLNDLFVVTACTLINTINNSYKDYSLDKLKTVAVGDAMLSEQDGEIKEIRNKK